MLRGRIELGGEIESVSRCVAGAYEDLLANYPDVFVLCLPLGPSVASGSGPLAAVAQLPGSVTRQDDQDLLLSHPQNTGCNLHSCNLRPFRPGGGWRKGEQELAACSTRNLHHTRAGYFPSVNCRSRRALHMWACLSAVTKRARRSVTWSQQMHENAAPRHSLAQLQQWTTIGLFRCMWDGWDRLKGTDSDGARTDSCHNNNNKQISNVA